MAKEKQGTSENTIGLVVARLCLFLILTGLVVSGWLLVNWLYKPGNFPIQKVELVNRLKNQESSELQKVAAEALNGGFFSLNVEQFRESLLIKLPWVKSVSVRKIWPNKLLVSITEHKPVVRWRSLKGPDILQDKSSELLSQEGIIFRPVLNMAQKQQFGHFALLTGPESNAKKILTRCAQMNEELKKLELQVSECGMNERRTWMIVLSNQMKVKLGKEKIMQQLERFIRVFSGQLKQYINSVDYADLRYANGFSIQWSPENKIDVNNNREQD